MSPPSFRPTEDNVSNIVAAPSNLIRNQLNCAEPVLDAGSFKPVVDSNRHLRETCITKDCNDDGERDKTSAVVLLRILVDIFSDCRSLLLGMLNTGEQDVHEETIRGICSSLACRGIDFFVRIGSTSYRQARYLGHELWVAFL